MQKSFLSELKQQDPSSLAIVIDGEQMTYQDLCQYAEKIRKEDNLYEVETDNANLIKKLYIIQKKSILEQLVYFLAYSGTQYVPVIVPQEFQGEEQLEEYNIPMKACMAVMTSGTTGKNKLLFREKRSWYDYFKIQNPIFHMGKGSRAFMQGSLSFTGNLNLYMAQLCSGGTIVAENHFDPKQWLLRIEETEADVIYLIPAKLRALKTVCLRKNTENFKVKMILSGSQSLGGKEAGELKGIFKNTKVLLYYGASELNYITYVTDDQMTEDKTLIGKAFPEVSVRVENSEIRVTTEYGIIGIDGETWIGDCGHMDASGNLYFDGRKDDICSVNGRKISMLKVENVLLSEKYIQKAAVYTLKKEEQEQLAAWIIPEDKSAIDIAVLKNILKEKLHTFEIPKRFFICERLPENDSGKIVKRLLKES